MDTRTKFPASYPRQTIDMERYVSCDLQSLGQWQVSTGSRTCTICLVYCKVLVAGSGHAGVIPTLGNGPGAGVEALALG